MSGTFGRLAIIVALLALVFVGVRGRGQNALAQTGGAVVQAADVAENAAFERPAGVEYVLADKDVAAYQASLAPLWTWDGDVGTYVDGQTQVRVVAQAGLVTGVEIIQNASAISDACLEAQMLYGLSVDGAGVASACAGMWTQAWAEAQAEK